MELNIDGTLAKASYETEQLGAARQNTALAEDHLTRSVTFTFRWTAKKSTGDVSVKHGTCPVNYVLGIHCGSHYAGRVAIYVVQQVGRFYQVSRSTEKHLCGLEYMQGTWTPPETSIMQTSKFAKHGPARLQLLSRKEVCHTAKFNTSEIFLICSRQFKQTHSSCSWHAVLLYMAAHIAGTPPARGTDAMSRSTHNRSNTPLSNLYMPHKLDLLSSV